jgi:hypothetical protein
MNDYELFILTQNNTVYNEKILAPAIENFEKIPKSTKKVDFKIDDCESPKKKCRRRRKRKMKNNF